MLYCRIHIYQFKPCDTSQVTIKPENRELVWLVVAQMLFSHLPVHDPRDFYFG